MQEQQMFHKYSLKFGNPRRFKQQDATTLPVSFEIEGDIDRGFDTVFDGGEGLELTQHQINFRISKSKEGNATSEITIYNISDTTRKFLEEKGGDKPQIELYVGYETSDLFLAFYGDVIKVIDEFDGVTRRTRLMLQSSSVEVTEAFTSRSYRGGVLLDRVYKDLIFDLGLPLGNYQPSSVSMTPLKKPLVVQGNTYNVLKRITGDASNQFFIEDGVGHLVSREWQNKGQVVTKISADTNMIGSPAAESESEGLSSKQNGNRIAINVTTTMYNYKIDDLVTVESKYHSGVYQIANVEYVGDYEGTEWCAKLKLTPNDGFEVRGER